MACDFSCILRLEKLHHSGATGQKFGLRENLDPRLLPNLSVSTTSNFE